MSIARLNLLALRQKRLFDVESDPLSLNSLAASDNDSFQVSRRQVLKSAGLVAAALTPRVLSAKGAVAPVLRGAFSLKEHGNALQFMLGKNICWSIDPARFSGNPKLTYDRSEDHLIVRLRDAFYPGTEIPADLTMLVKTRLTDCSVKLTMAFGQFKAEGSLEKWLTGEMPLKSQVKVDHLVRTSNAETMLLLKGNGQARFSADWKLQLKGDSIATLHGLGESLTAKEVTLSIPPNGSPSLFHDQTSGRRSIFMIEKSDAVWSIDHGIDAEKHWSLGLEDDALDRISIEAIEDHSGISHALLAEQVADTCGASFTLHAAKAIDGSGFRLPLVKGRLAILFSATGEERAFAAQYHDEPVWLHINGCSLLVGAPRSTENASPQEFASFEAYARDGVLEHLHCEPALLKIASPLSGAIVEPADVPQGTRLAITTSKEEHEREKDNPYLATLAMHDNGDENALLRFPANFIIGVVRPDDLLALKFEFINMEFKSEGKSGLELVKTKGKDIYGSYLVVHFPLQNIAEQAFFETKDDKFKKPDAAALGLPPSSSYQKDTSGEETPAPPPVQARAAGPSRLAFYLPDGVDSLSYSLKALLDWTKLEPSIVPVAFPPPPPPLLIYLLPLGSYKQAALAGNNVGSNYKVNGSKTSRAHINKLSTTQGTKPPPEILTDIRHSPKFTVQVDESVKQGAISNIRQHTKANLSNDQLSAIGDLVAQQIPGNKVILNPGLFLDLTIRKPHLYETALETPYRLILSPNQYAGWAHRSDLASKTDAKGIVWTELWHTRLGIKRVDKDKNVTIDEQDDYYRTLRAVWSPDYNPNDGPGVLQSPKHFPAPGNFFRMSLDARDRHELVELTSGFAIPHLPDTEKRIIRADRLMLSSLGAWMNTRGAWDVPFVAEKPLSLEEWRHRSTMGRDHYVRVVYKGFLFPFGHRASLIKVTERKFVWEGGYNVAYLRQRMFIVVRQPLMQYPAHYQPNDARKLPFQSIEITTLVTPNIKPPETEPIYAPDPQTAFWPHIAADDPKQAFRFHCIGTDWEGRRIEFVAPLAFIDNTRAYTFGGGTAIATAIATYSKDTAKSQQAFTGQKIAYAEAKKSGDTTFETTTITFGAEPPDGSVTSTMLGQAGQPAFYPTMEKADLHIESVKQIAGVGGPSPMKYHTSFVQKAWDDVHNAGQVFLQVLGDPIGLGFGGKTPGGVSTDKVGGLVSPSMAITGLSRLSGPLSGNIDVPDILPDPSSLPSALKGDFDPSSFFGSLDPKSIQLLGGISLMDILQLVSGASSQLSGLKDQMESQLKDFANDAAKQLTADVLEALPLPSCPIPSYISQMIYDAESAAGEVQNALKIPKQIQILFKWNPEVKSFGPFVINDDPKNILSLTAMLIIPVNAPVIPTPDPDKGMPDPSTFKPPSLGTPAYTVIAKLQKFTMDLFGVIALKFNAVTFKMESGKKADINADIEDVSFEGPLAFVNELEKAIPSNGFSDPVSIVVTPTGVKVGFDLALPTLSVGAFALAHVAFGAELSLPFTGDPLRFRFHFCTRENPFLLTIYCFGGGGFFGIELGLDGLELMEASFEFGAAVALDFGVASGSVSIMAGIYFKLQKKPAGDECLITGYVRVNGNLNICGIITVSIELYLEISYDSGPPKKCWGEATLTLKVSVLFFSISFSTTMRKEFVDPSLLFKDYMVADDWATYHLAFVDNFQVLQ